jgi:trk system potassium uptake protein TrkA
MNITIVGAGAVGFNLASSLSTEGHDVSVVERRPEHLTRLKDRLDVSVVEGTGTSSVVLREAGTPDADLFIAVTDSDEVNMVSCALAHQLGSGRRIARVRNLDFSGDEPLVEKRQFGISRYINPDDVTVSALVESILSPGVTDVAEFGDGEILLRGTILKDDSPFIGVPLHDLRTRYSDIAFLVAAITRDNEVVIPAGDTRLEPRDHVFLIMSREALPAMQALVFGESKQVSRLVIYGASRIGVDLARRMETRLDSVVLIDPREPEALQAAHQLNKTLVLRGEFSDPSILTEANLRKADYFVGTSQRDEMNLVAAALCRKAAQQVRVGVVTAEPDFVPALESLDLDLVINERLITVDAILRFARPGRYLSIKRLNEQGAEIMELIVQKQSRADGATLQKLSLPRGALVVAILRAGEAILPQGGSEIQSGDRVVLVALPGVREKAARMFFHKRWISLQEHR